MIRSNGQKGNSPGSSDKVPKFTLSGKGCGDAQTARRLAQKQPSFKECVTATLVEYLCAGKLTGAKRNTESMDLILRYKW